jgi:hypothetical protein
MNDDMESRLTDAMKARTRNVEPADEQAAVARISSRVGARRRRGIVVLGVAAALAVLVGTAVLLRRDDGSDQVHVTVASTEEPSATTSTTPTSTSTTTTAPSSTTSTTVLPAGPAPGHVWPLGTTSDFTTPEDAASTFLSQYLGMFDEHINATGINGDHAIVDFFRSASGAGAMSVDLVRHADHWFVVGARANEIVVDTPRTYEAITNPLTVSGQSVAFEAQLGLEVRPVGSTSVVATGQAMGGSTEMQPFSTTLPVPTGGGQLVLIVFEGDARGVQSYAKATVVLLGPDR